MEIILVVILALFVIGFGIKAYNDLNPRWHEVEEAVANIEVALTKRTQLTTELSTRAAPYVGHERFIQLQVSADRARAGQAMGPAGQGMNFFAGLAASFPELRADQTYHRLMNDLTSLETDVQ